MISSFGNASMNAASMAVIAAMPRTVPAISPSISAASARPIRTTLKLVSMRLAACSWSRPGTRMVTLWRASVMLQVLSRRCEGDRAGRHVEDMTAIRRSAQQEAADFSDRIMRREKIRAAACLRKAVCGLSASLHGPAGRLPHMQLRLDELLSAAMGRAAVQPVEQRPRRTATDLALAIPHRRQGRCGDRRLFEVVIASDRYVDAGHKPCARNAVHEPDR